MDTRFAKAKNEEVFLVNVRDFIQVLNDENTYSKLRNFVIENLLFYILKNKTYLKGEVKKAVKSKCLQLLKDGETFVIDPFIKIFCQENDKDGFEELYEILNKETCDNTTLEKVDFISKNEECIEILESFKTKIRLNLILHEELYTGFVINKKDAIHNFFCNKYISNKYFDFESRIVNDFDLCTSNTDIFILVINRSLSCDQLIDHVNQIAKHIPVIIYYTNNNYIINNNNILITSRTNAKGVMTDQTTKEMFNKMVKTIIEQKENIPINICFSGFKSATIGIRVMENIGDLHNGATYGNAIVEHKGKIFKFTFSTDETKYQEHIDINIHTCNMETLGNINLVRKYKAYKKATICVTDMAKSNPYLDSIFDEVWCECDYENDNFLDKILNFIE